ncbi:hypothetical protein B0H14DRAFT_3744213 [Mycena olivaceomarginata]|nr:hypothetical protein B0H14DRAFT_3744213 [Mycena olivaceomarginata]
MILPLYHSEQLPEQKYGAEEPISLATQRCRVACKETLFPSNRPTTNITAEPNVGWVRRPSSYEGVFTPQAPIAPFNAELAARPYPAGDYLIVRGVHVSNDPENTAVHQVDKITNAIRANDPDGFRGCRLVTSLAPKACYVSCVYIRLHPDLVPTASNPEPRVDWLELIADGIRSAQPTWEVAWAPQADKDKRMWKSDDDDKTKRKDPEERRKQRDQNQKVIDTLRKHFDDAGRPAVDGYRLGESAQAVIVLAHPAHVDAVLRAKTVTIGARTHAVSAVRQIEIERPFEIAVRGFSAFPESRARQVCDGWDAASAIDEGAKKIDSALGSVVRRMEAIERQAQALHAATEARMGQMESTLATVATSVSNVVGRVEDLSRALFIGQQDAHLSIDLSSVDNDMAIARRTIDRPINDDEGKEATAEYIRLKAKRAEIIAKLDALRDGTNGRLIAPPGPTIAPPPLPPRTSTPPPGIPNKRPRTSAHGPDAEPTASNAHASSSNTNDMEVDDDGSILYHAILHHINIAINARNPHAFVLSESKTNSKTGPNLPNGDYNIFEEPGVQSDNFHTYKWGVAVGIRKNIQSAQRVAITTASLRGRVVAVDIVLPTTTGQGFIHRMIGAYAPWDPGFPDTRDFWPDLTALVKSTTTSWSVTGDLNATVSASERTSGGANARTQFIKFLNEVDAVDIWSNNPQCNRHHDRTSRAGVGAPSGNIIDRVVTSRRQYADAEISVADRSQDFVPSTNHRAVAARIQLSPPHGLGTTVFPAHKASLNAARIKFPTRAEKNRHKDFRIEIEKGWNSPTFVTATLPMIPPSPTYTNDSPRLFSLPPKRPMGASCATPAARMTASQTLRSKNWSPDYASSAAPYVSSTIRTTPPSPTARASPTSAYSTATTLMPRKNPT